MSKLILSLFAFFVTANAFAETRTVQQMLSDLGFKEKKGVFLSNPHCNASYELADDGTLSVTINSIYFGDSDHIQIKQDFEFQEQQDQKIYIAKLPSGEAFFGIGNSSNSEMLTSVETKNLQCVPTPDELFIKNPAIEISLLPKGRVYDPAAEKALYQLAGKGISDQTLSQFVILSVGFEGGAVYCVELNRLFRGRRAERTMKQLEDDITSQVKPNGSTAVSFKRVASCEESGS